MRKRARPVDFENELEEVSTFSMIKIQPLSFSSEKSKFELNIMLFDDAFSVVEDLTEKMQQFEGDEIKKMLKANFKVLETKYGEVFDADFIREKCDQLAQDYLNIQL